MTRQPYMSFEEHTTHGDQEVVIRYVIGDNGRIRDKCMATENVVDEMFATQERLLKARGIVFEPIDRFDLRLIDALVRAQKRDDHEGLFKQIPDHEGSAHVTEHCGKMTKTGSGFHEFVYDGMGMHTVKVDIGDLSDLFRKRQ